MTVISAAVILTDHSDTQGARTGFMQLGFEVHALSDTVLLLTAETVVFERGFHTNVTLDATGPHTSSGARESRHLPTDALPETLRGKVRAIEFEAPPDFGPTNF